MVYELSAGGALAGIDRIMGALPKDWFNTTLYGLLGDTTGLSLGEWHPHAVIFETVTTDASGTVSGPKMTLPGHELGHTFGLSVDPTIKSWPCSLVGDLGIIACGVVGGFDEYKSTAHPDGVPTWGYWVPQGPIPPALSSATGEQCNSFCMMGSNPINAHDNWSLGGRWVDSADYDQLINRLQKRCGITNSRSICRALSMRATTPIWDGPSSKAGSARRQIFQAVRQEFGVLTVSYSLTMPVDDWLKQNSRSAGLIQRQSQSSARLFLVVSRISHPLRGGFS